MSSPTRFLNSIPQHSSPVLTPTTPPSSSDSPFSAPAPQPSLSNSGAATTLVDSLPAQLEDQLIGKDVGVYLPVDNSYKKRPLKRPFELTLPSNDAPSPLKKVKNILTTVSAKKEKDIKDLHGLRMLQLARASREAFSIGAKYRLSRIHEINVMRTIAHDEYEEALALLKAVDAQIGEIRHSLVVSGTAITTLSSLNLSAVPASLSDSSIHSVSPITSEFSSHFD